MTALLAPVTRSPALPVGAPAPRVLVADANAPRLDALAARCGRVGWTAVGAADATQAVALATRHLPHAIVLQAGLAGGSLLGALARLRGIAALRRVPVIVCGVVGDAVEAASLYAGGATRVLPDTMDREALFMELASWVAPHVVAATAPTPWAGRSHGAQANTGGLALAVG